MNNAQILIHKYKYYAVKLSNIFKNPEIVDKYAQVEILYEDFKQKHNSADLIKIKKTFFDLLTIIEDITIVR